MNHVSTILFADSFHLAEGAERRISSLGTVLRLSLAQRDELISMAGKADIIIAEYASIDEAVLKRAERLKGIVVYGVGVNHVDLAGAARRGIPVANSRGGNAQAVAELSILLLLECLRHAGKADGYVRSERWGAADSASLPSWIKGRELRGKTLGIIGAGTIGSRVALLGEAFGMKILVTSGRSGKHPKYEWVPLEDLLAASDAVSVNVPITPDTRGLLSRDRLCNMKKGSVLVITSRGGIVDENALAELLESGHLAGAGLDVFQDEPIPSSSPLLRAPNTVLTPHMGGSTEEAVEDVSNLIASCCERILGGEIPETTVNGELMRHFGHPGG